MAALILTIILASLLAAIVWLVVGSRFHWAAEPKVNDLRNLLAYAMIGLPFVFIAVFYLLERV